jgi:hypothetical protein
MLYASMLQVVNMLFTVRKRFQFVISLTTTQFYQPLLSLTRIYLQFIMPDTFQPHEPILSGSMFASTLHV